ILRCFVILAVHVVDESEREIQLPILRILPDSFLEKRHSLVRLSGSSPPLRQENRACLIGNDEMGIQICRDLQQWREKVVADRMLLQMAAEVLNDAGPVNIGQQAGITKAHPLKDLTGRNVEHFLKRGLRATRRFDLMPYQNRCRQ